MARKREQGDRRPRKQGKRAQPPKGEPSGKGKVGKRPRPAPDVDPQPVNPKPGKVPGPQPDLTVPPIVDPQLPDLTDILTGYDHTDAFSKLQSTHPLLLLPVRIETRFAGRKLKIRVYPDQLHLDQHSRRLTADEEAIGRAFWAKRLTAATEEDHQVVQQWLVERIPARRAAWVARLTRPKEQRDGSLSYPNLTLRDTHEAARAAALPDRWAAVGWVQGEQRFVQFGNAIPDELAFSPALGDAVPWSQDDGALPVDAGMSWMVDYDEAVAKGMGITVALEGDLWTDVKSHGLTLLLMGISGASPTEAAASLADLLESHHYSDGLEFIPQGTPTNNTDEGIAGWTAAVDDLTDHFARELDGAFPVGGGASNGQRLAGALGLEAETLLTRVLYGDLDEESGADAMNRALWPVTWGRYFEDMMAPVDGDSILGAQTLGKLRQWFIDNVRGGAHLPAIAVGAQPYGTLPVRRSVQRQGLSGWWDSLEWILLDLRERWRDSLPSVPRLDPVAGDAIGADPKDDAVVILGSVPHPGRFVVRRLTYQYNIRLFLWDFAWLSLDDPNHDLYQLGAWYRSQQHRINGIESQLDVLYEMSTEVSSLLPRNLQDDGHTIVDGMISMVEAHRVRQEPLQKYYPFSVNGIFDNGTAQQNDPKLFWSGYGNATEDRLFTRPLVEQPGAGSRERASTYLGHLQARLPRLEPGDVVLPGGIDETGGVGSTRPVTRRSPGVRSVASARRIGSTLPLVLGEDLSDAFLNNKPLLYQLIDKVIDEIAGLEASRYNTALETLKLTPADELELRLRETLGLATHRLDAWLGGYARERLDAMRQNAAAPTGVQLGGFGWVEDLKPDEAGTSETQGFIHAPSLSHAATAAVLRSGWTSHGSTAADSTMSVDLRSDRVRLASWILDGVRQGQALGDLLGSRFERQLHDNGLARFIDDCRRAVFESQGIHREPRSPVDGLELSELYQSAGVAVEGGAVTIRPGSSYSNVNHQALQASLDSILTSMDSVADACIADSVHHFLQGNTARASATLDAVSTGELPPPELRSFHTPRPSVGVSHRLMLMLGKPRGVSTGPRATAQPELEAWLAGLLPKPSLVVCSVVFEPREDDSPKPVTVTLADLIADHGLSSLDLVFDAPAGAPEGDTDWSRRVAAHVLSQEHFADWEEQITIEFDVPHASLPEGGVNFREFADLASRLKTLLSKARPLDGRDFAMPGAEGEPGWELDELESRIGSIQKTFEVAVAAIESFLPEVVDDQTPHPIGDQPLHAVRDTMRKLDGYGIRAAIATTGFRDDKVSRTALYDQAWQLAELGRARIDKLGELQSTWDAEDASLRGELPVDSIRLRRVRDRSTHIFGRGFPILARFVPDDFAQTAAAFRRSDELLEGDPGTATGWLQTVGKVRAGAGLLDEVFGLLEFMVDASRLRPLVAQLPLKPGERWAAVSVPPREIQGRLALFALDDGGLELLAAGQALSGLVFDAWLDQIGSADQVTGVALNFDAPSSRPPQAMLLVVPPDDESWSFDLVVDSVMETFEAAKLRAVDPDILLAHGHQAPAVFPPGALSVGEQPEDNDG